VRLDHVLSTLRYAVRAVVAGRGFTAVAVLCLGLAVAANTTMFSVFDAMFLRPLPFPDANRLTSIAGRHPETGRRVALSLDDARGLAALAAFQDLGAYTGRTSTLSDSAGDAERIGTQLVTSNLFAMLGTPVQRGRPFDDRDDHGAGDVALISDALWQRRYQRSLDALGRAIRLDDATYTIVGVMPPQFRFPSTSHIWIPMAPALGSSGASSRGISIIARLRTDASLERANAELAGHVLPAAGSRPVRTGLARSFAGTGIDGEERLITSALAGATALLLLIACVNVANLLLARGAGRRREIAVRAALGASRARIIGQLLTESVLLALASAAVALPLAWFGIRWVHDAVPPIEPLGPYYVDWSLDTRTFLYTLAVALVAGLAFGLAPAFDAAGRRLLAPLRESGNTAGSRRQRRVHGVLIVAQIALAVTLLAGAALFVRTYARLSRIELGYDASHLMTFRVYFTGKAWDAEPARQRAVDDLAVRLRSLPGAHASTVTDLVPLDDQGGSDGPVIVEGRTFEEGKEPTIQYAGVAGRWPETFDVPILEGRTFDESELAAAIPVALVNRKLATMFWPGQSPIGRRFRLAEESSAPWLSVIGVVPDVRTVKLDEGGTTPPTAWLPHRFISTRNYGIVVRTRTEPGSVVGDVRAAVRAVDPSLALFDVYPMAEVRWLSYWMYVMWGTMFGAFGAIALLIAAIGVYGVVFFTVALRTREIGVRVALGARRGQVVGPMLRRVGWQSALGLTIGILGALALTPLIASLLLGVSPNDPGSFAAVSLLLAAVAVIATWIPAWRASAVDPTIALRDQ
jgi:predicted permease